MEATPVKSSIAETGTGPHNSTHWCHRAEQRVQLWDNNSLSSPMRAEDHWRGWIVLRGQNSLIWNTRWDRTIATPSHSVVDLLMCCCTTSFCQVLAVSQIGLHVLTYTLVSRGVHDWLGDCKVPRDCVCRERPDCHLSTTVLTVALCCYAVFDFLQALCIKPNICTLVLSVHCSHCSRSSDVTLLRKSIRATFSKKRRRSFSE